MSLYHVFVVILCLCEDIGLKKFKYYSRFSLGLKLNINSFMNNRAIENYILSNGKTKFKFKLKRVNLKVIYTSCAHYDTWASLVYHIQNWQYAECVK